MIRNYKNSSGWPRISELILLTVFFAQLFFISKPAYAQDSTAGSFEFDGHMRNYEVFFPHNFQPNMPLVVNIHGRGATIELFKEYTLLHEAADTSGFIVVYPQGLIVETGKTSWNVTSEDIDPDRVFPNTDDVGFISALIDTIHAHYDIDLARVYCCGFSEGGEMTFRMAGECGQRFAAVAGISSTLFDEANNWQRIRPMPILHMHGTADGSLPYWGRHGIWPVSKMIEYWLNTNHCTFQSDTFFVPDIVEEDNCTVQKISFTDCDGESELIHYKIINGGHSWPSSDIIYGGEGNKNLDINANIEILNFFEKYQNPLADIAYGKSTELNSGYIRPDGDTLIVTAQIANPENHPATVFGMIKGENTSFQDSIQLFDDGLHQDGEAFDNLWGGAKWFLDINEDIFAVRLRTRDLEEETKHDIHLSGIDYCTSIGPITFEDITFTSPDTIPNPGDQGQLRINLKNMGSTATASNITTKLISIDHCVWFSQWQNLYVVNHTYGDIAPGASVQNDEDQFIRFLENCSGPVNFALEIYSNGIYFWSDTFTVYVDSTSTSSKELEINIPKVFALSQNYPNPFNPKTVISWQLPVGSHVEFSIYNLLGQKVRTLVSEWLPAGYHEVEFDGQNLSSGIYLYRIEAGEWQDVKKMVFLK